MWIRGPEPSTPRVLIFGGHYSRPLLSAISFKTRLEQTSHTVFVDGLNLRRRGQVHMATANTIVSLPDQATAALPKRSFLTEVYGLKSWLLTQDHKRIGILYLITITLFFLIGGTFAGLIRLELLTPQPDLVASDTYNKLFSMHGIIMIFLFLIPSVPATLGNFLIPLMIGAKDLAFPKLNLLS